MLDLGPQTWRRVKMPYTVTETKPFIPSSLQSGVTYRKCPSKIRNSPTLVQVSVLLKFRAVLYGTSAICIAPNPVARGANLLFFQGKFSLHYVIKGQKALLFNYLHNCNIINVTFGWYLTFVTDECFEEC